MVCQSLLAHAPSLRGHLEAGVLVERIALQRCEFEIHGTDNVDKIGEIHVALPTCQKQVL